MSAVFWLVAAVLVPQVCFAEPAKQGGNDTAKKGAQRGTLSPVSETGDYSPYEQEAIDQAFDRLGVEIDPYPEGKVIERIEIVVLEVFEPRDPVPGFFNVFHTLSKRHTVERELLVRPGDRYSGVLVDETARNLRTLPHFTVVLCVPFRGSSTDTVGLVVITKDIWSLRMSTNVQYSRGGLEALLLQPAEINLFGSHHTAALHFELDPASWTIGALYVVPRFSSQLLRGSVFGDVIMQRDRLRAEGSFGGFWLGRQLLTSRTPWSWYTNNTWVYKTTRRFVDAKLATYDAIVTPENDAIPYAYRTREIFHRTMLTRSYGWASKKDYSFGIEYDRRDYEASGASHSIEREADDAGADSGVSGADRSTRDALALREFVSLRVPTSTTRLSPFFKLDAYSSDFIRVLDMESLGLQEDHQLGHALMIKVYPSVAGLGSTRTLLGIMLGAQYTVRLGDGLARASVESTNEIELDRLSDGMIQTKWRVITPRFGIGRLLIDGLVLHRYRNFLNQQSILGGEGRLRGYPSNFFVGESMASSNLEFRTRPLAILTWHVGAVVFYDAGVVWDRSRDVGSDCCARRGWPSGSNPSTRLASEPLGMGGFDVHHSVGFGVRTLFPQLDRVVFRADMGFPLEEGTLPSGVAPYAFFFSVAQAFPMPLLDVP